jgi:hypothetical protein
MRVLLVIAVACTLVSCTDSKNKNDDDAEAAESKLDRPSALARPPAGRLPAELRPPR